MLDGLGVQHGIDVTALLDASDFICTSLARPTGSKAGQAMLQSFKRAQEKLSLGTALQG